MSKVKFDPKVLLDIACFLGASISVFYLLNQYINESASSPFQNLRDKKKLKESINKFKKINPKFDDSNLSEHEKLILSNVITPAEISVTFADIGGLDPIIDELKESVLLPLTHPEIYNHYSNLLKAPKGVLLHGPPGCGKTMLAKALACESGANFVAIKMSSILDKWVGESNKLVDAIFSLANKLQPCIIFIDEIDSFLRDRTSNDHEVTAMLKAEFMQLWDGLKPNGRIMILGATNRPDDIDTAFMRRLPKRFHIDLPDIKQRLKILSVLLKDVDLDQDLKISDIAFKTDGFSGSDLKELCRNAAFNATREYIKTWNLTERSKNIDNNNNNFDENNEKVELRALNLKDFFNDNSTSDDIVFKKNNFKDGL
ncbi:hypothetical protein PACTADRAFT_74918 [Pachysolen tannophilus NRRL Y-2460]|uniref:AAA+ ATPase domain-containing protein n=1 Tax=Pachysolen tannophilus NRRL Y-2460 TaxID=669874 RepID=A0A1E4U0F7_PACTA|nr:hypothetical protein PACTADRAFT_74918 [Pachysolen tannophilus NRRL Y-2460]